MVTFILRRSVMAIFVISGSFAFIYGLAATIGDPLAEIRLSNPENLEYLLLAATRELRLDQSIPERFFGWYSDVIRSILNGEFTLGTSLSGRPVSEGLLGAVAPTFWLVIISIIFSLLLGAILGMFVAIRRQGFREPLIGLLLFLGYVSPVFWISHLIKQYLVVILNDRAIETITWYTLLAPLFGSLIFLLAITFFFLAQYSINEKLARKRFAISLLFAIPMMAVANSLLPNETRVIFVALNAFLAITFWLAFWIFVGRGMPNKAKFGIRFGILWVFSVLIQKLISVFPNYMQRDEIAGRPFPSFAYESVWYSPPEFWILQLDRVLHLLLPSLAITITTTAIYYQVTKNAAIEALESDYVRMARAKGINELEVLVRHVFRSCYLSLINTFVPNYLYLFNGVIIVELVFGWQGIGVYLLSSMFSYDLNRLMGGIFVIGLLTFVAMVGSDLLMSRVDARIRAFK